MTLEVNELDKVILKIALERFLPKLEEIERESKGDRHKHALENVESAKKMLGELKSA